MKFPVRAATWFLFLLFPASSWAFRLSPMIVSFSPSGTGTSQNFVLENTGKDKISVEIAAFHRFMDADGKEMRTPTDEFSVFPQQLALLPKEKRTIRVTWTGNRQLDRELNYRLVVTELPVDQKDRSAEKNFVMQYVASLYVTPDGVTPNVVLDSFKVLPDGKGDFVFKNTGRAHRVLKGLRLFVETNKTNRAELRGEEIQEFEGENILSLSSRHFVLPIPAEMLRLERQKPGSLKAEIELQ